MRANTIGDDFKFTRLSNDSDLQRFIKENTINLNKGKYIHVQLNKEDEHCPSL